MKLKINNNFINQNIIFSLSENINNIGMQKDIDDFILSETNNAINKPTSNEILIYTPSNNTGHTYTFYFNSGTTYLSTTEQIDISSGDTKSTIGSKSFYMFEFYDTFDSRKQIKLFQTYLIGLKGKTQTIYSVTINNEIKELYKWFIPENQVNYLKDIQGSNSLTIYCKISFYNSKTGVFHRFLNSTKESQANEIKNYFEVTLDTVNRKYNILNVDSIKEISQTNKQVIKKAGDVTPTTLKKPVYPEGTSLTLSGNTMKYI